MIKSYPINSYLRVPIEDVYNNLTSDFRGHLRALFNAREDDVIKMEFGSDNSVIFHFKGEL